MLVGDVFLWENYPHQVDGGVKRRWFVCLGEVKESPCETSDQLIRIVAPTTTTQTDYYLPGGHRARHPTLDFKESAGYGFSCDCLLDFGMPPEIWRKDEVEKNLECGSIQIKGHLPDEVMRRIYEKVCDSHSYPLILKKQIKAAFNGVGIMDLSDPPSRRRVRR